MKDYTLFYSWQSDKKNARNLLDKALDHILKKMDASGIHIEKVEDSRGQLGAQNISVGLLESIAKADFFIADLTPVTVYNGSDGPKLCPNSNAMFEYGFAIGCHGDGLCKQFVYLEKGQKMPQMPFDINQRKTIILTEEELEFIAEQNEKKKNPERNTKNIETLLESWILDSVAAINEKRSNAVLPYHAYISFSDGKDEATVNPVFKRISYYAKPVRRDVRSKAEIADIAIKGSLASNWVQEIMNSRLDTQYVKPQFVSPRSETHYESRVPIKMCLNNVGENALENIHINISLSQDSDSKLYEDNVELAIPRIFPKSRNGSLFFEDNQKEINIHIDILNPGDSYLFDVFYLLPPPQATDIELNWIISSKTFRNRGTLTVQSHPLYEDVYKESDTKAGDTQFSEKITHK